MGLVKIRIGISTCPNDTFAFFPLLERRIDWGEFEFKFELLDVQELNERLRAGELDVGKASFHAALQLADRFGVFSAGSALGFGNGPLLLSSPARVRGQLGAQDAGNALPVRERESDRSNACWPAGNDRVLCPGEQTTAHLLFRMFSPEAGLVEHVIFSDIAPALLDGRADYGVCIHEGRFTYHKLGLGLVADLGELWHRETGHPLPLGGILGSLQLPAEVRTKLSAMIGASVRYALEHREEALPVMQRYAQEMEPEVIWSHVDLYVNQWTVALGETGEAALATLADRAAAAGLLSDGTRLQVLLES